MRYIILTLLLITSLFSQVPEYDRTFFGHGWTKDGCKTTRVEVLIEESSTGVVFDSTGCNVILGLWYDKYNDTIIYKANLLDVDHMVPLKDAWISGAWKWNKEKRVEYANYMEDKNHLIAVLYRANRSKGSKAPHLWMPKNKKIWTQYCNTWCDIKIKWNLTVSKEELLVLKQMLKEYREDFPKVRQ